ncbi:MAG: N-acetylmuramoyl-L-alanine amidase, partial [Acidimicrobiales bacterium]
MTQPPVEPDRSSPDPRGDPPLWRFSRRTAIGLGGAALAGASLLGTGQASASGPVSATAGRRATLARRPAIGTVVDALRPEIAGRDAWGDARPVRGEIVPEDDVRFLLVHHTASTNDYDPDDVVGQIRDFHSFHTGPEKGWPDVAYNFFVDRFGRIWEARAGSIDGPVRGDATGGSQGFALLCALIGNHAEAPITADAQTSMVALLAWLAERHAIDTSPGATVDFVSRGSNRWSSGTAVTARTISG